jgi:hypothetical protein
MKLIVVERYDAVFEFGHSRAVSPEHKTIGGPACVSITQTLPVRQSDFAY